MGRSPQLVSQLGESGLIRRITERIGASPEGETWSGDDTAVVYSPGPKLLMTTDFMVEEVDFSFDTFAPSAVGWKAFAINLSDIAAMGGIPEHALVSMSLRGDVTIEAVDGMLEGMLEAAERWGVSLVGGDLSSAREVMISVSLLGSLATERAVLRSGARAGDAICVTGSLGGAAGGLIELSRGSKEPGERGGLVQRQCRPEPRVAEGQALAEAGVSSMIDLSDGLAVDLERSMVASGTGCEIDSGAIPVDDALESLRESVPDLDPLSLAITGGEDFELLFTVAPDDVEDVRVRLGGLGTPVTEIGRVTDGEARLGDRPLHEWRERGWDHLLGR